MKLGSFQFFLDQEEAEEVEDGQLLESEVWRIYLEYRNALREFLSSVLSFYLFKRYYVRMELFKKCFYYIEIFFKYLVLGDQNSLVLFSIMFQFIDFWKFQRMKKVGIVQIKIQFLLLGDLLEQLDCGRVELDVLFESFDSRFFLVGWGFVGQRLVELSVVMDSFLVMMVSGRLYIKYRLVFDVGVIKISYIRFMLSIKMFVMFDRKELVVYQDWVSLRWFVIVQLAAFEQFELRFKLLDLRIQQECTQCGIIFVVVCIFDIRNLLFNRFYKFIVKRAESYMLVYEFWWDSFILEIWLWFFKGLVFSWLGRLGLFLIIFFER